MPDTLLFIFFFFNDTATTEIYTLSLHDALPICRHRSSPASAPSCRASVDRTIRRPVCRPTCVSADRSSDRSEEHTSELQSRSDIVCRLLLEKKKTHLISNTAQTLTIVFLNV